MSAVEEVERVSARYLTRAEFTWLTDIQELFSSALNATAGFTDAVNFVAAQLETMTSRKDFQITSKICADLTKFRQACSAQQEIHPAKRLTLRERQFSEDLIALINFVFRNGILFRLIVNVLCHDLVEIAKEGSLARAFAKNFSPKVTGWASYDPNDLICEPDDTQGFNG